MALVHDHEIEELGWIVSEEAGAVLALGEGLIDGEVHFAAMDHLTGFNLVTSIAEGSKQAVLGLVHEDVAIGEVKDAGAAVLASAVQSACTEFPAHLERHERLAGASRHGDEEAAFVALQNGFDGPIDGDLLVVALTLAEGVIVGRE